MWNERRLAIDDGVLVWDEDGEGPSVVFLSGGPGDSGHYLRPLAEPLARQFHCVIPDLRGTGRSAVRDQASLSVSSLLGDLEAIRLADRAGGVFVVGHSFGANLALLYAATCPAVAGAVLIGLGPLDERAADAARANTLASLSVDERAELQALRRRRTTALAAGNQEAFQAAFLDMFRLRLHTMVLDPALGRQLLEDRRRNFDHEPHVHARVGADLAQIDQWAAVRRLHVPLLIVHGEQDFEPEQAEAIAAVVPSVAAVRIAGAAHLPWLDRPRAVADALREFITASSTESSVQRVRRPTGGPPARSVEDLTQVSAIPSDARNHETGHSTSRSGGAGSTGHRFHEPARG